MDDPSEDQIRVRAYQLWEAAGRPDHRAQEFWLRAERDIQAEREPKGDETEQPIGPDETSETFLE
ncbi:MAG: DUF2934 domain-containing protein [Tardiphaga sp.]